MRMLRVLHDLFYQPMADGGFFPLEELQNIFPSLDELIEVHCECGPPPRAQPGLRSSLCGITSTSTARGGPHVLDPAGLIRSGPALHVQYAPHFPSDPPPPPSALFLDRLVKRRQDSGHLIEEIGDVLLARVRVPGPALAPIPSSPIWGPCTPSKPPGPVLTPYLDCQLHLETPLRRPSGSASRCSSMGRRVPGSRKFPPASAAASHLP